MYQNNLDEEYPRESFPVVTPSPKTSASKGIAYPSASGHLSKVIRLPNLNDWSNEQDELWRKKDPIEVERYYLNTHNNIKKMKKSPKGKPTLLIAKKKEWRTGLSNILVTTVEGYKLVHTPRTLPKDTSSAPSSVGKEPVTDGNKTKMPLPSTGETIQILTTMKEANPHGRTLGIRRIRPMPLPIKKREESDWHVDYNNE